MKTKTIWNAISPKQIILFFFLVVLGITIQTYLGGQPLHTRHNNFLIFHSSFAHLLQNKNLYVGYPDEYYDLYKYSPSFALFMGIFSIFPTFVGLLLFNLLNAGIFIAAIKRLGFSESSLKCIILYVFLEALISVSSSQTNLLMAGLVLWAFIFFERKKLFLASFCIVFSVYIKIFGAIAFVLWILYPQKLRFIVYAFFWFLFIWALPLIFVSKENLMIQYQQWFSLIKSDNSVSYGASVMGILHSWFTLQITEATILVGGLAIMLVPYLKAPFYLIYRFRLLMLASVLIWMVIFNHKAESPTYIIAMSGVAIWYFSQPPVRTNTILLMLCLVFTTFSSTDIFTPGWITNRYVEPFAIKAVFCFIIWIKLVYDSFKGTNLRDTDSLTFQPA
jgi:hypothetical protein